jgi:D-alanyl-lipoteichoic acid acyltransferase DltB (MBOAT superfamily)
MVNRQAAIILLGQSSTMLLIALWHGISWNFVVWGIWHALGLFVHNRWADFAKSKGWATPRPWANVLGAWVTFNFVALGWVWFALPTLPLSWGVFKKLIGL